MYHAARSQRIWAIPNPLPADAVTILADARGAFHLPAGADWGVGGWVARFEESQIKTVRTGSLDVAVEERDGREAPHPA